MTELATKITPFSIPKGAMLTIATQNPRRMPRDTLDIVTVQKTDNVHSPFLDIPVSRDQVLAFVRSRHLILDIATDDPELNYWYKHYIAVHEITLSAKG